MPAQVLYQTLSPVRQKSGGAPAVSGAHPGCGKFQTGLFEAAPAFRAAAVYGYLI